jgi:cell division protein FtsL
VSPAEAERERLLARAAESAVQDAQPERQEPEEIRRHLRLVDREARRRANRRHIVVSAAIAGVAVVFLALVTMHVLIAENQFRLDQLQQQASVQQERYEKLRLEVAELEAPARIVSAAEGPLGMRQPASVTYVPAPPTTATPTSGVAGADEASALPAPGPGVSQGVATGHGSSSASAPEGGSGATVASPQGDADWPLIKPYLSGTP